MAASDQTQKGVTWDNPDDQMMDFDTYMVDNREDEQTSTKNYHKNPKLPKTPWSRNKMQQDELEGYARVGEHRDRVHPGMSMTSLTGGRTNNTNPKNYTDWNSMKEYLSQSSKSNHMRTWLTETEKTERRKSTLNSRTQSYESNNYQNKRSANDMIQGTRPPPLRNDATPKPRAKIICNDEVHIPQLNKSYDNSSSDDVFLRFC